MTVFDRDEQGNTVVDLRQALIGGGTAAVIERAREEGPGGDSEASPS